MRNIRRPGFLGETSYWFGNASQEPFDTPAQAANIEERAREAHTSAGSARGGRLYYIPRIKESRIFDWLPFSFLKRKTDRESDYQN